MVILGSCIGISTGDDYHCNGNPFVTGLDYRLGAINTWYDHGYLSGSCTGTNGYQPRIETYWRYAAPSYIDLGTISTVSSSEWTITLISR